MNKIPDDLMALRVGDHSVGEALQRAVRDGALLQREDGSFDLPKQPGKARNWLPVGVGPELNCRLYMFLFHHIYQ